jgi:hypothetical protein
MSMVSYFYFSNPNTTFVPKIQGVQNFKLTSFVDGLIVGLYNKKLQDGDFQYNSDDLDSLREDLEGRRLEPFPVEPFPRPTPRHTCPIPQHLRYPLCVVIVAFIAIGIFTLLNRSKTWI